MLPFDYVQKFMVNMPRVVVDQKTKFESDDLFKKLSRESEVRYTGHKDRPIEERRVKFKAACRDGFTEIGGPAGSCVGFPRFQGFLDGCRSMAHGRSQQINMCIERKHVVPHNFLTFYANISIHQSKKDAHKKNSLAFINSGINFQLFFGPYNGCRDQCHFEQEKGKVHLRSSFIMNGVCVRWRGSMDLQRLDGIGCLEFDEELAKIEDARLHQQIDAYNKRVQDLEEKQRAFMPPRLKRPRNEVTTTEEMSPNSSGSVSN